jgi:DNA-binding protein Fis
VKAVLSHRETASEKTRAADGRLPHRSLASIASTVASSLTETAGMAIVDNHLRYVQIDEALARINGLSVEEHLGKTVHDVLPQLAPMFEPILRHIITTGEPALNIEIEREVATDPGVRHRRLVSFIPILDNEGKTCGVGMLAVDVPNRRLHRVTRAQGDVWFERARDLVDTQPQSALNNRLKLIRDVALALETAADVMEQAQHAAGVQLLDIKNGIDFYATVSRFEIDLIERALRETDGNQTKAARLLGLKHTTLHDKIRRYKINWPLA